MKRLLLILTLLAGAAQAREDQVQIHGNAAGAQTLSQPEPGVTAADYRFNDRGRGDVIQAHWRLDASGLPVSYEAKGNDYWKVEFSERFGRDVQGLARWRNRIEQGETKAAGFYLPANPPPEFMGVLARALLKAPGRRLPLLPAGEARLEGGADVDASGRKLTLYRISGIEFTPVPVWLDDKGDTAGVIDDWFEVLQASLLPALAELQRAQQAADQAWHARLALQHSHKPQGALLIRGARLFAPVSLGVRAGMSVLVRGERIVRVEPDADLEVPAGAEVIAANGRFLMPGLWDVHQHFSNVDGVFDLIAGVTSARDMANDNLPMLARVHRFDAGTELGPRVLLAGIIEGIGPLAGPTDVRVDTADKARAAVDWYADHGYAQVKIYSSFSPALVAAVADRAHERGLRVSGHVPAFTHARAFVEAGADEIQHLNFILLNFFPDVKDTRTRDRYTVLADRLAQFDFNDGRFADFVTFLRQHQTVLDPTLVVLEGLFSGEPARAAPALRPVVERFPTVVKRRQLSGAVAVPPGKEAVYAQALPGLLRMLKKLHEGGVTIMPGSDGFAGYSLHRELELYAQAGIPNAEVLRIATLVPARVLGVEKDRGTIAAGKLADMILVDGDPLKDMSDIRRVHRTIKGGQVYEPAALEQAMGMTSR
ncbi:imidazolonepropionase-like amidohydrolase [Pelomonas saccharophila]|uniref:Imidazolonepropionase-like amidohydrolase n=1 Tax=Roseateles saccharophilus TaxID=304 RepID=A0ABU1YRT6_ROSSA|nr:amidohydrolase family protein [Roseateles saccharophilus]MDR7271569.1 imidazolonepropionase-like amidohydrolase [Roseateles saccharophilus]